MDEETKARRLNMEITNPYPTPNLGPPPQHGDQQWTPRHVRHALPRLTLPPTPTPTLALPLSLTPTPTPTPTLPLTLAQP